jgi:hypothetical protein
MQAVAGRTVRRRLLFSCVAVKRVALFLVRNPHLTSNAKEGRPGLLGQVPNELCPCYARLGKSWDSCLPWIRNEKRPQGLPIHTAARTS